MKKHGKGDNDTANGPGFSEPAVDWSPSLAETPLSEHKQPMKRKISQGEAVPRLNGEADCHFVNKAREEKRCDHRVTYRKD